MSIKEFHIRMLCVTVITGFTLASCGPATPAIGGIVQGAVYADLNGSGTIDPEEGVLEGAEVTLTDCGPNQTLVTASDGFFNFTNLPEGTCLVSVAKAGWIFSGSYPALTYPVPVASNPDLPTSFSLFMAPVMDFIPTDTPTPPIPTETPLATASPTSETPMVTPSADAVNCRFGPGTGFSSVGGLPVGSTVPIHATTADKSWWQIESPQNPGTFCWVSADVTNTFGDLSLVPIVPIPTALVTAVAVTTPPVIHGFCHGPNPTSFSARITTNGPVTVLWHFEIYDTSGAWLNSTTDQPMVFAGASSQVYESDAYKRDCGSYVVKVVTTSPNSMTGQANWTVVEP